MAKGLGKGCKKGKHLTSPRGAVADADPYKEAATIKQAYNKVKIAGEALVFQIGQDASWEWARSQVLIGGLEKALVALSEKVKKEPFISEYLYSGPKQLKDKYKVKGQEGVFLTGLTTFASIKDEVGAVQRETKTLVKMQGSR